MKILFIRPPDIGLGKFKNLASAQHPINLVYLATHIKPHYGVNILDLQATPLYKQELFLYIKKQNPDVIGITFMTCNFDSVKEITNIAKQLNKIVILGGTSSNNTSRTNLERDKCRHSCSWRRGNNSERNFGCS